MKVKHFNHCDLDAAGCGTLTKFVFNNDVNIEYLGYNTVNERIEEFVNNVEYFDYDLLLITDISVNEDVAIKLDNISGDIIIRLIDHHKTAEWLNHKYIWAKVFTEIDCIKQSGTNLLYETLQVMGYLKSTPELTEFVENIRLYDTWDWTRLNKQLPKDLNDLLGIVGIDDFVNQYTEMLANGKFEITNVDKMILGYKRKEIERYVNTKISQTVVFKDEFDNSVAFIIADAHIGDLHTVINKNIPCDYCCIWNGSTMNLRSVGDFDVSTIAQKYGGGGHKNASGCKPVKFYLEQYLKTL